MGQIKLADRVVGRVVPGKKAFLTYRTEKHWFRKFEGFGMNKGLLVGLQQKGIEEVWVFYKKVDGLTELWKTTILAWLQHGSVWEWTGKYGKHLHQEILRETQLILNKKYFEVF